MTAMRLRCAENLGTPYVPEGRTVERRETDVTIGLFQTVVKGLGSQEGHQSPGRIKKRWPTLKWERS